MTDALPWYQTLLFAASSIFVAMDVIGVVPIYLGMTRSLSVPQKSLLLKQSIAVALGVAVLFWIAGDSMFKLLGISVHDFKVGGGIVLLVMSILELVRDKRPPDGAHSSSVVPLGVPLITGPALITILMLQVGLYGHLIVLGGLLVNFAFAWLVLSQSQLLTRFLGESGITIISKIMALFTTAIAFAMIRTGILASLQNF